MTFVIQLGCLDTALALHSLPSPCVPDHYSGRAQCPPLEFFSDYIWTAQSAAVGHFLSVLQYTHCMSGFTRQLQRCSGHRYHTFPLCIFDVGLHLGTSSTQHRCWFLAFCRSRNAAGWTDVQHFPKAYIPASFPHNVVASSSTKGH